MRTAAWVIAGAMALGACMPTDEPTAAPTTDASAVDEELPVRLSEADVSTAGDAASCVGFEEADDSPSASHVDPDGPAPPELYDRRPATAGDHLGEWVEAAVYDEAPDERSVVHNHEHGAVSVWFDPSAIADGDLEALRSWAASRNAELANDAGAGIIVAPFDEGLADGAAVAFRAWSGGLDCAAFDRVVADGFLLERFGQAPEGNLAPDLDAVVVRSTAA